jgi:hypothetical protein
VVPIWALPLSTPPPSTPPPLTSTPGTAPRLGRCGAPNLTANESKHLDEAFAQDSAPIGAHTAACEAYT